MAIRIITSYKLKWISINCFCEFEKGNHPWGWSPRLIIALGSWEETVPHSRMWITIYIKTYYMAHTLFMWIHVNICEFYLDLNGLCGSAPLCASVRQWYYFVMCGSAHRNVRLSGRSAAVCGSVWQCAAVQQCGSACVELYGSVAVWGSARAGVMRQCAGQCAAVCGSARGCVW